MVPLEQQNFVIYGVASKNKYNEFRNGLLSDVLHENKIVEAFFSFLNCSCKKRYTTLQAQAELVSMSKVT